MSMHPDLFPQWLAGVAARPVDAPAHRRAVTQTMDYLLGAAARRAVRARAIVRRAPAVIATSLARASGRAAARSANATRLAIAA